MIAMQSRRFLAAALGAAIAMTLVAPALAAPADPPLSGAIFTTLENGAAVNFNIYDSKEDVYLDGGPGQQAPQGAAGLPDGTYYFQVTDPPGKTLLTTDPITCRQFVVSGGIITAFTPSGACPARDTGTDVDWNAVTIQLFPYLDTPNPGGEYKVWVTPTDKYDPALGKFGFIPRWSKTDNFKVGPQGPLEIDTRFWKAGFSEPLDGMRIVWTDTLGASNVKWSYYAPEEVVFHEAHVEAVEVGTHYIAVADQDGCVVGDVSVAGRYVGTGARSVAVDIKRNMRTDTVFVDVDCQ
jgi:hypothetical protein